MPPSSRKWQKTTEWCEGVGRSAREHLREIPWHAGCEEFSYLQTVSHDLVRRQKHIPR